MRIAIYFFSYFLHLLGVVLMCASFLYEDEEGKIQSRVQEWWIKLDDKQSASRSRVAAFMQEVARLTAQGFDSLFGKRLLSLRFIVVSVYLSIASFFLFGLLTFSMIRNPGSLTRHGLFLSFLSFLTLASFPALLGEGRTFGDRLFRGIWWAVIPVFALSISGFLVFVYKRFGAASTFRGIGLALLPFAISFVVDLAYIVLTRWILRRIRGIDRVSEIVLMLTEYFLILAIILVGLPDIGLLAAKYSLRVGGFTILSVSFDSIDILVAFSGLLVALVLFFHRLFWPFIQRPLYVIQRFRLIKNKKWLIVTGVILTISPWHMTIQSLIVLLTKLF